jgi:hypothetical protein
MYVYYDVGKGLIREISNLPDRCPHCHISIVPNALFGNKNGSVFEIFFSCPNGACKKTFIGYYDWLNNHGPSNYIGKTSMGSLSKRTFSDTTSQVSPLFEVIYNQAFAAEQQGLLEICGVGYRKALEFLIKDYAIKNNTGKKDHIEKLLLGQVIEKYVSDDKIKNVAKRAVWLGNDETHYIRKWEGKNLSDLKRLIDLTVHWIEMEELTKSFSEEMPDNK